MPDYLETTVDKFIFRVATDRLYSSEGMWVLAEGETVRLGITDFLQQRSGDIAFVEVRAAGTTLAAGGEVAVVETIKVDITLSSPVSGTVVEVNPALEEGPEVINQDPFGEGWLAVLSVSNWSLDSSHLLSAEAYFKLMKGQAEEEAGKV